jgi:polygalacturonase
MLPRRVLLAALPALTLAPPALAAPAGLLDVRSFGARGDGKTDDTQALRAAHAAGKPVWYPRPAAYYRITGVIEVTASVSGDSAEIRCLQDGSIEKSIFRVRRNRTPLTITGMVLNGLHRGQTRGGQWSMGVLLAGARNVTITRNVIRAPYGDCVYLGNLDQKLACRNIRITENQLLDPRRCCVAVVCGDTVLISGNTLRKPNDFVGTVDLEPDGNGFDYVTRVQVLDNRVETVGDFFVAAGNNGVPSQGVVVRGNRGRWKRFSHITESARLVAPVFADNVRDKPKA